MRIRSQAPWYVATTYAINSCKACGQLKESEGHILRCNHPSNRLFKQRPLEMQHVVVARPHWCPKLQLRFECIAPTCGFRFRLPRVPGANTKQPPCPKCGRPMVRE